MDGCAADEKTADAMTPLLEVAVSALSVAR